jgi:hypothetical protein
VINDTIDMHRESKKNFFYYEPYPTATDEEILDFIQSIPAFDERLKDFLVGNLSEQTIIISDTWELEFLKKTQAWAASYEWLHGDGRCLSDKHLNSKRPSDFLTLPY